MCVCGGGLSLLSLSLCLSQSLIIQNITLYLDWNLEGKCISKVNFFKIKANVLLQADLQFWNFLYTVRTLLVGYVRSRKKKFPYGIFIITWNSHIECFHWIIHFIYYKNVFYFSTGQFSPIGSWLLVLWWHGLISDLNGLRSTVCNTSIHCSPRRGSWRPFPFMD